MADTPRQTGLDFALAAHSELETCPADEWATRFVELRMEFHRKYGQRLVTSTEHGADFFRNVLAGPEAWKEKGEYGDNFRKMLKGLQ